MRHTETFIFQSADTLHTERQLGYKKIFQQTLRLISTVWCTSDLLEGKPPSVDKAVM